MRDVVIVGMARTAIGTFGGIFKKVKAAELAIIAAKEAMNRAGVSPDMIEDTIIGHCFMRTDEINIARVISLKSGVPFTSPAFSVQRQCASGMEAMVLGMQKIQLGEVDVVLAGGTENMSNVPYVLYDHRWGAGTRNSVATDALFEGLTDPIEGIIMGITAENLAEKYNISREEQDEIALLSHTRALAAIDSGRFVDEIVPVPVKQRRGEPIMQATDEHPRRGLTIEGLAKLRPAFKKDGSVTAGNSSGLNDGAAAVVLMTAERANALGLKILARITGHAVAGVEPELMGYGPVPAVNKLLKRTGKTLQDIELIELNEAFAAQYLACEKLLELDRSITNVNGSGISLGHPVGCTGTRISISLIHEMEKRNLHTGIATLCVGGGMGKAVLIER